MHKSTQIPAKPIVMAILIQQGHEMKTLSQESNSKLMSRKIPALQSLHTYSIESRELCEMMCPSRHTSQPTVALHEASGRGSSISARSTCTKHRNLLAHALEALSFVLGTCSRARFFREFQLWRCLFLPEIDFLAAGSSK